MSTGALSSSYRCDYLNKAFEEFNNWTIAAASYNMGINGMRSNLQKQNIEKTQVLPRKCIEKHKY